METSVPREIGDALIGLHKPCPHLTDCQKDWCEEGRRRSVKPADLWQKYAGLVPRGVSGGTAGADEVEVVFVLAEPSEARGEEPVRIRNVPDADLLDAVYRQSTTNIRDGAEDHHRWLRDGIMRRFLGDLPVEEIMKRAVVTCSVYCSNPKPFSNTAAVPRGVECRCAKNNLLKVLEKYPRAIIVALGNKADRRLHRFLGHLPNVHARIKAMHPTAAQRPVNNAQRSWEIAAAEFRRRKGLVT